MTPESRLLASVVRLLKRLRADGEPIWWVKLSGSPMQRRGLPDLFVVYHGHAYGIELKTQARRATPLQAETLRQMSYAGAMAAVCRSVREVEILLGAEKSP